MGFRFNATCLILAILLDSVLTVVRPTWKVGGIIAQYVLLAVHAGVVIAMGVAIFGFFSNTIWFTAGLLGELLATVWPYPTIPFWILRLIFVAVPWMYQLPVKNLGDRAMSDNWYVFFFVCELVLAVGCWTSMWYTMCCMTELAMYHPYHKASFAAALPVAALGGGAEADGIDDGTGFDPGMGALGSPLGGSAAQQPVSVGQSTNFGAQNFTHHSSTPSYQQQQSQQYYSSSAPSQPYQQQQSHHQVSAAPGASMQYTSQPQPRSLAAASSGLGGMSAVFGESSRDREVL